MPSRGSGRWTSSGRWAPRCPGMRMKAQGGLPVAQGARLPAVLRRTHPRVTIRKGCADSVLPSWVGAAGPGGAVSPLPVSLALGCLAGLTAVGAEGLFAVFLAGGGCPGWDHVVLLRRLRRPHLLGGLSWGLWPKRPCAVTSRGHGSSPTRRGVGGSGQTSRPRDPTKDRLTELVGTGGHPRLPSFLEGSLPLWELVLRHVWWVTSLSISFPCTLHVSRPLHTVFDYFKAKMITLILSQVPCFEDKVCVPSPFNTRVNKKTLMKRKGESKYLA